MKHGGQAKAVEHAEDEDGQLGVRIAPQESFEPDQVGEGHDNPRESEDGDDQVQQEATAEVDAAVTYAEEAASPLAEGTLKKVLAEGA